MSILDTLKSTTGCQGGIAIYNATKAAALAANLGKPRRKLRSDVICKMEHLFPKLDLDRVRLVTKASVPGSWFNSNVRAMTLGYTIYWKGKFDRTKKSDLKLLIHELVHVDQVRRLKGEISFACKYGAGFLAGGSYDKNPMEIEAEDFAKANPPPDCHATGEVYLVEDRGTLKALRLTTRLRRTWDIILAGDYGGGQASDLFFYSRSEGVGAFVATHGQARLRQIQHFDMLRTSWDAIVSGQFGGTGNRDDLMFYDRSAGDLEFYRVDPTANKFWRRIHASTSARKTWDIIVPGQFGGTGGFTDVMFYDRGQGEIEFYRIDPTKSRFMKRKHVVKNARKSWDIIVPGQFGGTGGFTDLLFYDRSAQEIEFYRVDPTANHFLRKIQTLTGVSKSWSMIVPGEFFSSLAWTDLMYYDAAAGMGEFYRVQPGAAEFHKRIATNTSLRKSWTSIVSGRFRQEDITGFPLDFRSGLFFYERE